MYDRLVDFLWGCIFKRYFQKAVLFDDIIEVRNNGVEVILA